VIVSIVENRERGLAFGADDYFVKPVDWARLLKRLRELTTRTLSPRRARLLLIDDDVSVHDLLEPELARQGYELEKAYSGKEGLERAEASKPDVIILVLMMPEMSGFRVAELLRETESTARIPILAFTAKDVTAEEREQLRAGSAIVTKGSGDGRLRRVADVIGQNVVTRSAGVHAGRRCDVSPQLSLLQNRMPSFRLSRRRLARLHDRRCRPLSSTELFRQERPRLARRIPHL